ncbi:YitT family protein [Paraliobacillus sediminis]|uniref:YitT family protein n=1 Tax=Paraliobacillus sediminis TaxID=1885916 RepID=UPI0023DE0B99|nr:YitT family protein [Paraliobacillus sediminis]
MGGTLTGTGMGIMLRYKTSTGGTDLVAQFLAARFQVNIGIIIFVLDIFIICLGSLLLSSNSFIFSAITILFSGVFTSICTWGVYY